MNENLLIPDPPVSDRFAAEVAGLIEQPWQLRIDALAARGWIAVPVEKGRHIEPDAAPGLALAIRRQGVATCYAIATEPLDGGPRVYEVAPTEEGLLEFSYECAGLNFVLLPPDLTFALLFTSEDYNLYAGPTGFVVRALGVPPTAAWAAFEDYASDPVWHGRLLEVCRRYRSQPGAHG